MNYINITKLNMHHIPLMGPPNDRVTWFEVFALLPGTGMMVGAGVLVCFMIELSAVDGEVEAKIIGIGKSLSPPIEGTFVLALIS